VLRQRGVARPARCAEHGSARLSCCESVALPAPRFILNSEF